MTGVFSVPLWLDRDGKDTPNKSRRRKLTLEKNILPPLLPGIDPAAFRSRVWRRRLPTELARLCITMELICPAKLFDLLAKMCVLHAWRHSTAADYVLIVFTLTNESVIYSG